MHYSEGNGKFAFHKFLLATDVHHGSSTLLSVECLVTVTSSWICSSCDVAGWESTLALFALSKMTPFDQLYIVVYVP